jgi:hypothetical protein
MDCTISPPPIADVIISRYEQTQFPKFRVIFEPSTTNTLLKFVAQPPEEATRAVVIENGSDKDITALRYRWIMTLDAGDVRISTSSYDSYMVDVYRPVLKRQDRMLVSVSSSVQESFIDHALSGGGGIGSGRGGRGLPVGVVALRFEIDLILFEDGELAGSDTGKYALELQCRKPAAEFVAKQIRLAEAEGRDAKPVLSALAQVPHLRDDFLASCTQQYAADFLRHENIGQRREGLLRHLENRPVLPKFYRRDHGGNPR